MIHVPFDTPTEQEWKVWDAEAKLRTDALIRNFDFNEKPEIDSKFYRRPLKFLEKAFKRKCAYCESSTDRFTIDVEHYRPKARVSDENRAIVTILDPGGVKRNHPGYYWLAYTWSNLLPSCQSCNQKRYHEEQDVDWGKGTSFPLRDRERYVWRPHDVIESEEPSLIHPRFDKPENHLTFSRQYDRTNKRYFCAIGHLDERGQRTIDIMGLNDENFADHRMRAYEGGFSKLEDLTRAYGDFQRYPPDNHGQVRDRVNALIGEINDIWNGRDPHTAFGRLGITDCIRVLRLNLRLPLTREEDDG